MRLNRALFIALLAFCFPLLGQSPEIVLLQGSGTSEESAIVGTGYLRLTIRAEGHVSASEYGFDLSRAPYYQAGTAFGMPPETQTPVVSFAASWTPTPVGQVIRVTGRALIDGRWVQAEALDTYWRTDPEQQFDVRLVPLGDAYTVKISRAQLATAVKKGLLTLIGSPGIPPQDAEPFIPPGQRFRGSAYSLEVPQSWGEPDSVVRPVRAFNLVYAPQASGFFDQDWRRLIQKRIVSFGKPPQFSERYFAYRDALENRFLASIGAAEEPQLSEVEILRQEVEALRQIIIELRNLLEGRQ